MTPIPSTDSGCYPFRHHALQLDVAAVECSALVDNWQQVARAPTPLPLRQGPAGQREGAVHAESRRLRSSQCVSFVSSLNSKFHKDQKSHDQRPPCTDCGQSTPRLIPLRTRTTLACPHRQADRRYGDHLTKWSFPQLLTHSFGRTSPAHVDLYARLRESVDLESLPLETPVKTQTPS